MDRRKITEVVAVAGVTATLVLSGVTAWTVKSYQVAKVEGRSADRREAALEAARWQVQNNTTTCKVEGGTSDTGPSPYRQGALVRYCAYPGGEVSLIASVSQRQADEQLARVMQWEK